MFIRVILMAYGELKNPTRVKIQLVWRWKTTPGHISLDSLMKKRWPNSGKPLAHKTQLPYSKNTDNHNISVPLLLEFSPLHSEDCLM